MRTKSDNRTIRRQVMVTDSMNEKIVNEARRFGLSITSYLELIVGQHFAKRIVMTMINDMVV